jgi:hypothetical protein
VSTQSQCSGRFLAAKSFHSRDEASYLQKAD